ncbi:hypothetical protein [Geobacter sp. AOG1]|uniref:hypothetical protein n=1 Tax=Geobacter sp. AOG1 TaxID=1566346 RepID=UPI001CC4273A|nr:hypothetical protein [Geobacter sp. AOG1]GFE58804.1 hypothetical protein AOG1_26840 [Geobacter sp. AOG1]
MNKRTTIVTVTLAILLVGSIAYAAEKRKQSKLALKGLDSIPDEALAAELLEATEEHKVKDADSEVVTSPSDSNEKSKTQSIAKQTPDKLH